jgi:putative transposase
MAVRVIGKVSDALRREGNPRFFFHGAVPYDQRNIRLRDDDVSISTIEGRMRLKVRIGEYQRARLQSGTVKSGILLCCRRDIRKFHLAVVVDSKDPPSLCSGILGVDLGIKNIAVDSEGRVYTDERVERIRTLSDELRGRFQQVGTKNAKRHLKKMSGRERRFKRDVNYCISKQIVSTAKGTCSTIAMEDLTGIRGRSTVRWRQRDRHSKWAFLELRRFVEYKAK